MLRKSVLLALAAAALVAITAPVIAQAESWYLTEEGSEEEVVDITAEFTGSLSSTRATLRNGACAVHAPLTLTKNELGEPTAEVEKFQVTTPCEVFIDVGGGTYVPVTGCQVVKVTSLGFPWHIHVAKGATKIKITGANFTNEYSGCAPIGIPNGATVTAEGTATATWNNTGGCFEFNKEGDMTSGGLAVNIDGSVCNEDISLK